MTAARLKRNHFAARGMRRRLFRQLFGQAHQSLAAFHFLPDILRFHARGDPQDNQIVDKIRTFADYGIAVAVHRVDDDLDCLLGKLLRHLGPPRAQKARRARARRIALLQVEDRFVEPVNRISHAPDHTSAGGNGALTMMTRAKSAVREDGASGCPTESSIRIAVVVITAGIVGIWPASVIAVRPVIAFAVNLGGDVRRDRAKHGTSNAKEGPARRVETVAPAETLRGAEIGRSHLRLNILLRARRPQKRKRLTPRAR